MKSILQTLIIVFLTINSVFAQETETEIIYFNSDKFELDDDSRKKLEGISEEIKGKAITGIKIKGHTDNDGSRNYNEILSKKRAMEVQSYFLANGVAKNKISIEYFGEEKPIVSNENDQDKQQNRRVEISIQYDFSVPKDFLVSFKDFKVNPNKDTTILLDSKGTSLHIPKNSFLNNQGDLVKETVLLRFREFSNSAEMAFSDIPMTYKKDNLEYFFNSSGMFELTASVNDKPIEIVKNKPLKIDYALARKNPEISFFKLNNHKKDWNKIQDIEPLKIEHVLENEALFGEVDSAIEFSKNKQRIPGFNAMKKNLFENVEEFAVEGDFTIEDDGNRQNATLLAEGVDAGHTYPDIIKGLNIESFGVYNCDQIYRLSERVSIKAKYLDVNGQEIADLHVLSLIDLQYNGAFSFDPRNFICDANGQNVLALFTKKGELYLLEKDDFAKMNIQKSGQQTFTMKNMTNEIKNAKDLANHLGIAM
ncbi:MAG: OmpA family protein [Salibacteraceae bacterium]|nr:OmpA family protein [Salibacteraceae bacterium]